MICDTAAEIKEPLTLDAPGEYKEALIKASQMSMKRQRVIYLYSDGMLFWACSKYQGKFLAKCWPGGRVVSRRKLEETNG